MGVRSIGTKTIVLIDRIVVLKNRRISLLPLRNAKCHTHTRPRFILATFTQPSSSIHTSFPLLPNCSKTPKSLSYSATSATLREHDGTVRFLGTILSVFQCKLVRLLSTNPSGI
jgi:hypothetical protein